MVGKVSISSGNKKMGSVPSVSLPPLLTCPVDAPCKSKCYAIRMCRVRASVREAYDRNLSIYLIDPDSYFLQIEAAMSTSRYFRFHVAGDIPNIEYLDRMAAAAAHQSHCKTLVFTKKYSMINEWLDAHKRPENLQIVFSEWGELKPPNPHNLPTAAVIFKHTEPQEDWKICSGNCTDCICRGVGCWELKSGETIAFPEH